MKYHKTIDIWQLPEYLRKHIHVGHCAECWIYWKVREGKW